jgi:hypothetical protein
MEKLFLFFQPGARSEFTYGPCTDLIWLVKVAGLACLLAVFYLRFSRRPMGALYWLAALIPGAWGVSVGLYMLDAFLVTTSHAGYVGPTPPEYFEIRAVFVMHYGWFLSCLLSLVLFYFYARDFIVHRFRL